MKKTFDLKYSLLLLIGYILYLLLETPLNTIISGFPLPLLYQGFISNLILLIPILSFVIFLLHKLNLKQSLKFRNIKIFLMPLAYLLFIIAMNFSAFESSVSFDFLIFIFGLCLVGFSEEFIFRGILFPKLSINIASIYSGAIVSSILFGVVHYINLINNPEFFNEITSQAISAFCFGVLMCGIFYKTKNLYVPALIHTIFNLQNSIRSFNFIRNDEIPKSIEISFSHPSIQELLSQELMFNLFSLIAGLSIIYYQIKKENGTPLLLATFSKLAEKSPFLPLQ